MAYRHKQKGWNIISDEKFLGLSPKMKIRYDKGSEIDEGLLKRFQQIVRWNKLGEYRDDLLFELKGLKGWNDSRSVASRNSIKSELKRLNVKIPRSFL